MLGGPSGGARGFHCCPVQTCAVFPSPAACGGASGAEGRRGVVWKALVEFLVKLDLFKWDFRSLAGAVSVGRRPGSGLFLRLRGRLPAQTHDSRILGLWDCSGSGFGLSASRYSTEHGSVALLCVVPPLVVVPYQCRVFPLCDVRLCNVFRLVVVPCSISVGIPPYCWGVM